MAKSNSTFRTALKFIWYDKPKSLGALMGIVISTFLIGQQTGIFNFLTDSMETLVSEYSDYIWIVDNKTENVNVLGELNTRVMFQTEALPGVEEVHPMFVGGGSVQFSKSVPQSAIIIGVEAPEFIGAPKKIDEGTLRDLIPEGAVCVDYFETAVFPNTDIGTTFEINNRKVYIAARTKGVIGFGATFVFTTIERARALCKSPPSVAHAFLVEVKDGYTDEQVIETINNNIFGVRAWKGKDLGRSTIVFLVKYTSIATSLGMMVIFALITGFFIVGLTLYSAAIDRLKDYGTMKAIGATNGYIRQLIYTQAALFAVLGFSFGFLLIEIFVYFMSKEGFLITYSTWFLVTFFLLIGIIAFSGATFAVRRITKLEPAEVFRF